MILTTVTKYSINPPPTEEELKKAKELVNKGKIQAKLNRAKNSQEAWKKLLMILEKIF